MKRFIFIIMFILSLCFTAQGQFIGSKYQGGVQPSQSNNGLLLYMLLQQQKENKQRQMQYDYEKYNFDWEFNYRDGHFTDTGFTNYSAVYNIDIKVYKEKLYVIFDIDSANKDILWKYDIDEVDIIRGEKYDKYRFLCLDIKNYSYIVVDFYFKQKTIEICFYFVDEELFLLLSNPRNVTIN